MDCGISTERGTAADFVPFSTEQRDEHVLSGDPRRRDAWPVDARRIRDSECLGRDKLSTEALDSTRGISLRLAFVAGLQAQEQGQLDSNETLFSVMAAVNVGTTRPFPCRSRSSCGTRDCCPFRTPEFRRLPSYARPTRRLVAVHFVCPRLRGERPTSSRPSPVSKSRPIFPTRGISGIVDPLLSRSGIERSLAKLQPTYQRELARYHEPVTRVLLEANALPSESDQRLHGPPLFVLVEMLAPPNQVHTRSYKDDYFIVITPAAQPRVDQVRHAYLHYLLDPLTTKFSNP